MPVALRPMTQTEFDAFRKDGIRDYAADHVRVGNWPAEGALARAEAEWDHLLPDALATKDHWLFTIVAEPEATPVGILWFARRGPPSEGLGFIYDILIFPEHRRKGYGSEAMRALEPFSLEQGLTKISLHVFGDNQSAIDLYEKVGYETAGIMMTKKLSR